MMDILKGLKVSQQLSHSWFLDMITVASFINFLLGIQRRIFKMGSFRSFCSGVHVGWASI